MPEEVTTTLTENVTTTDTDVTISEMSASSETDMASESSVSETFVSENEETELVSSEISEIALLIDDIEETTESSEVTAETVIAVNHGAIDEETDAEETIAESTVIETLPIETTATVTESTVAVAVENSGSSMLSNINIEGLAKPVGIIALIAALLVFKKKYGGKIGKNTEKSAVSAREKDKERLSEIKLNKAKKDNKGKKPKKAKSTMSFRRTVADTLPWQKILDHDIWQLAPDTYSKTYAIDDINYNLSDDIQQEELLSNYSKFLNTLDETVDCQISCYNSPIDKQEYENRMLVKLTGDEYDDIRREYNERVLRENISKGQNAIRKQLYITMTIKAADEEAALRRFSSIDLNVQSSFNLIGNTNPHALTNVERLELVKNIFIGSEVSVPKLTRSACEKGLDKVYCAPDYFEFKTDYFLYNDKYAKCVFIKEYPSMAGDGILNDLMSTNIHMLITTNLYAYDAAVSRKKIQHQISAVETNMAQRESAAAKAGNFSAQMPVAMKNQIESYKELYDMITVNDQKLFQCNTIIMVIADSYEELMQHMEVVSSSLKADGCSYSEMKWQQEDGMCDCLPIGTQRKFQWYRSLPTESISIFVPFNVKEVQQQNGIYYGLNKLSNNVIACNRITSLINPAGFILGCPGSGKSFSAKREMVAAYLNDPTADIIIIDPEREYPSIVNMFGGQSVKISTGSSNYINPFEFDLELLNDDDVEVIADKCQLIISFISCMSDRPLTAQEKSFIDRCVSNTYAQSGFLGTLDPKDMPTLGDFYNVMKSETDVPEDMQKNLLIMLEMYVTGSAKYFNNRTNINIHNRLMSYDIKDLSGVLKTQAMLLVLDNIWNRLSANRNKGIATWVYIDEIHVLFADPYSLEFIRGLYKRARKYGGILTGITQNIEDLLRDDSCRTMLSNSEFLMYLKQSPADSIRLMDTLHYTESEISFVNNVGQGEGLLVLGGKDKIPFYDKFPKDTALYRSMSTNFAEKLKSKE